MVSTLVLTEISDYSLQVSDTNSHGRSIEDPAPVSSPRGPISDIVNSKYAPEEGQRAGFSKKDGAESFSQLPNTNYPQAK